MPFSAAVLALLLAALLLAVGWRLHARIHTAKDFELARRRLPDRIAGISQAVNSIPMWLSFALAALAYSVGLAALWAALANMLGMVINWWLIAPRLREYTAASDSDSLTEWFAASAGDKLQATTVRSAGAIVSIALILASLTALQWAGAQLAALADVGFVFAVTMIGIVLLVVLLLGGFWSASVADVIQAGLGALLIVVVAAGAWHGLAHPGTFAMQLRQHEPANGAWFAGYSGVLALSLSVGMMFAALGATPQPHVVVRYLACRDQAAVRHARRLALGWSAIVLGGSLSVGWCARVMLGGAALGDSFDGRALLAALSAQTLSAWFAMAVAFAMSAIFALSCLSLWMSAAIHLASIFSGRPQASTLMRQRVAVAVVVATAFVGAVYLPKGSEDRLWFCWQSLSAAFGPLLLVRLTGKRVRPGSSLGAMWSGFILTLLFHLMPETPGDLLERSLPFIASLGIALSGGDQRRNPDRADRGDKTVHDHLPI